MLKNRVLGYENFNFRQKIKFLFAIALVRLSGEKDPIGKYNNVYFAKYRELHPRENKSLKDMFEEQFNA